MAANAAVYRPNRGLLATQSTCPLPPSPMTRVLAAESPSPYADIHGRLSGTLASQDKLQRDPNGAITLKLIASTQSTPNPGSGLLLVFDVLGTIVFSIAVKTSGERSIPTANVPGEHPICC